MRDAFVLGVCVAVLPACSALTGLGDLYIGAASSAGGGDTATSASHANTGAGAAGGNGMGGTGDGGGAGSSSAGVGGAATPFPSTGLLDDFNRADGPPGDQNWILGSPEGFAIAGQQLSDAVALGRNAGMAVWKQPFGVEQEVFVRVVHFERDFYLLLKIQSPAGSCDSIQVFYPANQTQVQVGVLHCGGSFQPVGYITVSGGFQHGDQMGARALVNGDVYVYKNGTPLEPIVNVAATAPWYAKGGRIGLYDWRTVEHFAVVDDFGGG
jgi:hypothetical protein